MSPDSFLIDPFLLFADGLVLALLWERRWKKSGRSRALPLGIGVLILAIFYTCSIGLFFDAGWMNWLVWICHAETGRDWMLNSGVFHFDYKAAPSTNLLLFAGAFFATYVLWLLLGARVGARLAARPAGGH